MGFTLGDLTQPGGPKPQTNDGEPWPGFLLGGIVYSCRALAQHCWCDDFYIKSALNFGLRGPRVEARGVRAVVSEVPASHQKP